LELFHFKILHIFRSFVVTFVNLIIIFILLKQRMDREEKILQEEFGEEYLAYRKKNKAISPIPLLSF